MDAATRSENRPFRPEIEGLRLSGIGRIAAQGLDDPGVIPLWFGEGDLPTAPPIREAAKRALDAGETFYNFPRGRRALRDALKVYLDRIYAIDIDEDRLSVPASTMLSITIACQMTLARGDHAIITTPNWPNIDMAVSVTGAERSHVRQEVRDGHWYLDLEKLFRAVRPETRLIFVNTPCNPTGWIMPQAQIDRLQGFCRDQGIALLADEVYHRNVLAGDVAPSFLPKSRSDDALIVVNGFSKAWAMTGWRAGWMVTPSRLVEQIAVLAECFNTGTTSFAQFGAIEALEHGEPIVQDLRGRQGESLEVLRRLLGGHGKIELTMPDGAFYAFPRIKGLKDSMAFAERLLLEERVGVAPGYTFGPENQAHLRLCFALSAERLEEALHRFVRFVDRHL